MGLAAEALPHPSGLLLTEGSAHSSSYTMRFAAYYILFGVRFGWQVRVWDRSWRYLDRLRAYKKRFPEGEGIEREKGKGVPAVPGRDARRRGVFGELEGSFGACFIICGTAHSEENGITITTTSSVLVSRRRCPVPNRACRERWSVV